MREALLFNTWCITAFAHALSCTTLHRRETRAETRGRQEDKHSVQGVLNYSRSCSQYA